MTRSAANPARSVLSVVEGVGFAAVVNAFSPPFSLPLEVGHYCVAFAAILSAA
jgi:hypothetical protein